VRVTLDFFCFSSHRPQAVTFFFADLFADGFVLLGGDSEKLLSTLEIAESRTPNEAS